jgi:hypothetical protein
MNLRHLKITSSGSGFGTIVELDGQRTSGIRAIDLRLDAENVNQATLEVLAPAVEFDGEARVSLSGDQVDLLKKLGWTPPPA